MPVVVLRFSFGIPFLKTQKRPAADATGLPAGLNDIVSIMGFRLHAQRNRTEGGDLLVEFFDRAILKI